MSKPLTKNDFLEAGIGLLADAGPVGLNIVALCERLDVTRGSFYHHFKSLAAYREDFLEYWENMVAKARLQHAEQPATFQERSAAAIALAQSVDWRVERAMRAWAANDADVAAMLSRVDQAVQDMVYRSLLRAGADPRIADRYAVMTKLLSLGLAALPDIPSSRLIEEVYLEVEWAAEMRIDGLPAIP